MNWFEAAEERLAAWKAEDPRNKYTPRARRAIDLAFKEAEGFKHAFIGAEHVLLGLVGLGDGATGKVLANWGLIPETVRKEVENRVQVGLGGTIPHALPFTGRMQNVIKRARMEAQKQKRTLVDAEHLLLGLLSEREGVAAQVFRHFNIDATQLKNELLKEIESSPPPATDEQA